MVATALQPEKPILLYDLLPEPGVCPYAQRAKVTLKEKNIPYEQKLFSSLDKPQDFLDLFRSITSNPNGRGTVPTIIDGDVRLTESHVVSEYLDTAYPDSGTKLFPTDARKLAKVRLFVELFSTEVQSNIIKQITADNREDLGKAQDAYTHGLKVVDAFLKDHSLEGGDFLLGSEFSYAEAATLPFLVRARLVLKKLRSFDTDKVIEDNGFQRLDKWFKAASERPSVKETLPPEEVLANAYSRFAKEIK